MMRDLLNALPLPDDRPIQSLCVIEELSGCPSSFQSVSKTHDQDIDADLYKDGFFRREKRYLCHSKSEGYLGYVIESIHVINARDLRPPGFTIIEQTIDTKQKAFKKKQICYKAVPRNKATKTVTDIIILSRSKIAPEGFKLVGEMNGLCICYKPGGPPNAVGNLNPSVSPSLPYCIGPNGSRGSISSVGSGNLYPGIERPTRPAPGVPQPSNAPPLPPRNPQFPYPSPTHSSHQTNTLYGPAQSALSGVPFVVNKKYVGSSTETSDLPRIKLKSKQQVEDEFYYSFSLEHDQMQRPDT